ncbi:MAG: hypothetical protein L0226_08390 [Acidobacteria bacterium]|nr:hypothetical protein [Acidobacteriota bacterium]
MTTLLTVEIGRLIISTVQNLRGIVQLAISLTIGVVVGLLLIRLLTDLLKLNPFGRFYHTVRRPTDEFIHRMRTSQFYYPLKRSLGFDPSMIMILIALAITWYVVYVVISNLFQILQIFGVSLITFGEGRIFTGSRYLIGALLLAVIFFLMALMTIVFVNWIFGLLRRASYWAMERLAPLLRIFEFGGVFAGWSFIILWIALTFAAMAVQAIFLSG